MRRKSRYQEADPDSIDLTPLLDVVFLLLIFFVISTKVFDPFGYEVELPESKTAPQQIQTDIATLTVLANGELQFQQQQFSSIEDFDIKQIGDRVILRADKNATHGAVLKWMDLLNQKGVKQVTLATQPAPTS